MKYLKTFENKVLKKYIIFKLPHIIKNTYYFIIAEIVKIENDKYTIRYHYSNIKDVHKMVIEEDSTVEYEIESKYIDNKEIIYQSDSLENCIDYINILINANEYNI